MSLVARSNYIDKNAFDKIVVFSNGNRVIFGACTSSTRLVCSAFEISKHEVSRIEISQTWIRGIVSLETDYISTTRNWFVVMCNIERISAYSVRNFIHVSIIFLLDSIIFGLTDQRVNDLTASEIKENYIPSNNLPMGVLAHDDRIFITLPRRRPGIPATIAFVSSNGARGSSPSLQAYPNFRTNEQHVSETE